MVSVRPQAAHRVFASHLLRGSETEMVQLKGGSRFSFRVTYELSKHSTDGKGRVCTVPLQPEDSILNTNSLIHIAWEKGTGFVGSTKV